MVVLQRLEIGVLPIADADDPEQVRLRSAALEHHLDGVARQPRAHRGIERSQRRILPQASPLPRKAPHVGLPALQVHVARVRVAAQHLFHPAAREVSTARVVLDQRWQIRLVLENEQSVH